jgi:DNA-binding MarR family transcriptional regulator
VPDDRRAVRIRLTVHAHATLPRIEANWRKLANTATAGLDHHERDQLVALLDHARDNLLALATNEESE